MVYSKLAMKLTAYILPLMNFEAPFNLVFFQTGLEKSLSISLLLMRQ